MQYRRLGRSGVRLSVVGLGNWLTFGRGVDEIRSRACIRRAFELGVNLFDTADVYHKGVGEEVYGRELKAFRRRELVIATKCFFPFTEAVNDRGLSRKHIFESLHDSLRRLQTDYIDLYQCHRHDPEVEASASGRPRPSSRPATWPRRCTPARRRPISRNTAWPHGVWKPTACRRRA
jgi:aryl-alcohol dehydrogenase-like predicted oxidoreductase